MISLSFLKDYYLFLFYVCGHFACMYVYAPSNVHAVVLRGWKRALYPMELELQVVGGHHVGAGIGTCVLGRAIRILNC